MREKESIKTILTLLQVVQKIYSHVFEIFATVCYIVIKMILSLDNIIT